MCTPAFLRLADHIQTELMPRKQMQFRCSLRSGAPRLTVLQIKQTKGSEMFKKTLAAAALLGAFAGSAVAADVTLYGVVDYGLQYTHVDSDKANTDAVDNFQLSSGNQSGARFGLKGSEDLGNGVKAGFHLENGFAADTGSLAQNSRLFGREARLFVNGAFGEVAFGRMGTLGSANGTYGLLGNLSPFGASWVGAVEYSTYYVGGIRADNTVTYKTPTFAGVTVYAQYSFETNTKQEENLKARPAPTATTPWALLTRPPASISPQSSTATTGPALSPRKTPIWMTVFRLRWAAPTTLKSPRSS